MRNGTRVLLAGLVLGAVLLAGCGGNDSPAAAPATSAPATSGPEEQAPGEPESEVTMAVDYGEDTVKVKVKSVTVESGPVEDANGNQVTEDGLTVVRLTVRNVGKGPTSFGLAGNIVDTKGREFESEVVYAGQDEPGTLNPEETGTYVLRFKLPADSKPKLILVWDAINPGEPAPLALP
jgi:hypothetical protein